MVKKYYLCRAANGGASLRMSLIGAAFAMLAACANGPPPGPIGGIPAPSVDPSPCAAQKQEFSGALAVLDTDRDARYDRLASEDNIGFAARVRGESDRIAQAIDRVGTGLARLRSCRLMGAGKPGSGDGAGASGDRLFIADLDAARAILSPLAAREANLRRAVEQAVAANPATRAQIPDGQGFPRLEQPYLAIDAAIIHQMPSADSPGVAPLRKGQRVLSASGSMPPSGWVQLALNDGGSGYVAVSALKPVQPNPVAVEAVVRRRQKAVADDPALAALFNVREILPRKRAALSDLIARAGTEAPDAGLLSSRADEIRTRTDGIATR